MAGRGGKPRPVLSLGRTGSAAERIVCCIIEGESVARSDRTVAGTTILWRLASAALAVLLAATLLAPPAELRSPKPGRIASASAPHVPDRASVPPRPRGAAFCRRCGAACEERRTRCLSAARSPQKARLCSGVQAACIIRCNEGLGCALPPPSLMRPQSAPARP